MAACASYVRRTCRLSQATCCTSCHIAFLIATSLILLIHSLTLHYIAFISCCFHNLILFFSYKKERRINNWSLPPSYPINPIRTPLKPLLIIDYLLPLPLLLSPFLFVLATSYNFLKEATENQHLLQHGIDDTFSLS